MEDLEETQNKNQKSGMELFRKVSFWISIICLLVGIGYTIISTLQFVSARNAEYLVESQNSGWGAVSFFWGLGTGTTFIYVVVKGIILTAFATILAWIPYLITEGIYAIIERSKGEKEELKETNKKLSLCFVLVYLVANIFTIYFLIKSRYQTALGGQKIPAITKFEEFISNYKDFYLPNLIKPVTTMLVILIVALLITWLPYFMNKEEKQK